MVIGLPLIKVLRFPVFSWYCFYISCTREDGVGVWGGCLIEKGGCFNDALSGAFDRGWEFNWRKTVLWFEKIKKISLPKLGQVLFQMNTNDL